MDELIQDSLDSGQLDSTGQFSLDTRQALSRGYRLSEPEEFILLLVSWASQCRASCCRINLSRNQVNFEHDGDSPSLAQLNGLVTNLSVGSTRALGSLSLAVVGALQLRPSRLVIEVPEGRWTPSEMHRVPGRSFRFHLKLPFLHRFQRLESLIQQRCQHSLLSIELNRKRVNRPLDLSAHAGSLALCGEAPLPAFVPASWHQQRSWERPYSLVLGSDRGPFETQVHGVGSLSSGHEGLAVGDFSVDASLLQPVHESLRAAEIESCWLELALGLVDRTPAGADLSLLLEELMECQSVASDPNRLESLLRRRLDLARQQGHDLIGWLCRLAQLELDCDRPEEALRDWREAYLIRRERQSAEGILLCLSRQAPQPESYREPLQTLLKAGKTSPGMEAICDWLWRAGCWQDALDCHRAWLPKLTSPSKRELCLKRLVAICQHLGLRLDEENYRAQAFEFQ